MSLNGFSEDDVKKLKEFGFFLNQKAIFNDMSIPDSVKLINHLQFYNQLALKIEDHILELKKVHKPAAEAIVEPVKKNKKS